LRESKNIVFFFPFQGIKDIIQVLKIPPPTFLFSILKREIDTITSHPPPSVKDWVYAPENRPFENLDITATQAAKLSLDEVRSFLANDDKSSLEIQETTEKIKEDSKGKDKKQDDVYFDQATAETSKIQDGTTFDVAGGE